MRDIFYSWTSFRAALLPSFPAGRAGVALLLLRIFVGTAFLFHGSGKIGELESFAQEFGVPVALAEGGAGGPVGDYCCLKLRLSMLSALIFDSSVEEGRPSCAAAPNGPDTRPLHSVKAASIAFFSCVASVRGCVVR